MRPKRLLRLAALVLVYVLVAEAGLQIAAFFMQRSVRAELPVAWVTGNLRVLCLGDSNTYGLYLERREEEAYPQRLEALWNERTAAPKLEVLNLGFPGMNSSRLVRELPRMLESFDPDIIILLIGVNDYWTLPLPLDEAQETRPRANFLERHSLLYRLYYLFRRGRVADQVEIVLDDTGDLIRGAHHKARLGDLEFDMGFAKADPGLWGDSASLKANLKRLIEQARAAETSLYLMTYASKDAFYTPANQALAEVAREAGTPLVDLEAIFASICPNQACPDMLFPDGHPNASGYRIIAEAVLKEIAGSERS